MPCAKSSLQTFVDWLHSPQQEAFVHVVTAVLRQDLSFAVYAGSLTFVPVLISGVPQPGRPVLDIPSFFQGNLVDTTLLNNSPRHIYIEMFENIAVIIETISGHSITETVRLTNITCASSGDSLTMTSPGDDEKSYELTLRKSEFLVIPHQRFRG